ncbi:MAG: DNA polymerase III subunit delta [Deltaproteobacteria bacterium]|nr:DNA polymerase III subunit delta [Deltaproteobacteria bacterium]
MATSRLTSAFPSADDIFAHLEKDALAPLYLFHGDETYLVDQAVLRVRRRMNNVPVNVFHAGEDAVERVLDTWGTPSLFAPQTLVVLKSAERLKAAERERLAAAAETRDATQPLVVCAHGKVDLRQQFFALCGKVGVAAEFRPPFANQLPGWAKQLARRQGVQLSDDAARFLADSTGADLSALAMEIEKVVAFVFPARDVAASDVAACVGNSHQYDAFDLADALGQRDRQRAFVLIRRVLTNENEALRVLHALVSHFRRLWRVKDLLTGGASEAQIERETGLRGQRLRGALSQSRMYAIPDLRRFMHGAAILDVMLKSSRSSPAVLFDALVLDMCARRT